MPRLLPGETVIDASVRIEELVGAHLVLLATDASGWSMLFRDPEDGRLWEHSYPHSERHGGGPPRLSVISLEEARGRYSIA